jgi:glycosyltransferase involved in cell wall biosynthesis
LDVRASIGKTGVSGFVERILYYTAIKLAKRVSDGISVASPALKEELCAYGINRARVEVITNGVSLDLFDPNKNIAFSRELRKRLNLSEKFIVMYHGSLGTLRGLPQTIEAIASIKPKHPDIIFFVLGRGRKAYEDELKNLVEEKSLKDNVYFHGAVSHELVPKFLAMCDLGIVPLAVYSFPLSSCPLKLLEYLAMAKPVISTDIPFSREIIELGTCGILIPSYKPEHIVAGIEYMYEKRSSLEQMGRIGRAIIENHYSWMEKARDFESFIGVLSH